MAVELELSEAPDIAELAHPAAIVSIAAFLSPLTQPAGATDLVRSVYDDERGLQIWTYGRAAGSAEQAPGVLFVHGGGWGGGAPSFHLRHMHELASRGYVTAALEYRLTPNAVWPAQIEDVGRAAAWLRAHAADLALDPSRLAVSGGSAGGHLAAMAALDPALSLKAGVFWYPAVDLRAFNDEPLLRPMTDALCPGADDDERLAASPMGHVSAGCPPVLTFTGDLDECTRLANIEAFHEALDEAGVRNDLLVFKGRDHGFDFHPADWQVCFDRMAAFLDEVL